MYRVAVCGASGWREEKVALRRCRGRNRTPRSSAHATPRSNVLRRVLIAVFVEGRGWGGKGGLVVREMLSHGGLLDGTVEQACDDGAPEQEGKAEGSEDGADADEDGALGYAGRSQVWRIVFRGHGRRRVRGDGSVCCGGRTQSWHVRVGGTVAGAETRHIAGRRCRRCRAFTSVGRCCALGGHGLGGRGLGGSSISGRRDISGRGISGCGIIGGRGC